MMCYSIMLSGGWPLEQKRFLIRAHPTMATLRITELRMVPILPILVNVFQVQAGGPA